VRHEAPAPLFAALGIWLRAERAKLSRHVASAKAIDYMLSRWLAFTRFPDQERICLTNNAAERALRGLALSRKSWLVADSQLGAERAALMYTMIREAQQRRPSSLARRRSRPHRQLAPNSLSRIASLELAASRRSGPRRRLTASFRQNDLR